MQEIDIYSGQDFNFLAELMAIHGDIYHGTLGAAVIEIIRVLKRDEFYVVGVVSGESATRLIRRRSKKINNLASAHTLIAQQLEKKIIGDSNPIPGVAAANLAPDLVAIAAFSGSRNAKIDTEIAMYGLGLISKYSPWFAAHPQNP